jgi:hypothetical protein
MPDKNRALPDLVEAAMQANEASKANPPIKVTPKKYGFDTEEEYWEYIRKAAKKAAEELVPPK